MGETGVSALTIFSRIVCGVDGTAESEAAVRQADRLLAPEGTLLLVAVANLAGAAQAGMAAPHAAELLQDEAERALGKARELAPTAGEKLVGGNPPATLLREAESATLVVVGSHGRGRTAGLLLGTVASRMLRDAPCSVLVARKPADAAAWPQSVVVGVDGSAESVAALAAARVLADRFDAGVRVLASAGDGADLERGRAVAPELEERAEHAVAALTGAAESADLVVVGSRGLHGLKALGSVSERIAHQARSSVLVVRPQ